MTIKFRVSGFRERCPGHTKSGLVVDLSRVGSSESIQVLTDNDAVLTIGDTFLLIHVEGD